MKQAILQASLIALLAGVVAAAVYQVHPRAPALYLMLEPLRSDEVGLKEINERWKGDVVWLDARPRDQFNLAHVPGARLLNEQDFDNQLLEMLDILQTTTKPVILYCGGQKCEASRHVREKLLTMVPLENCFVLKGGWPAWLAGQGK
jgi:rhodanese-related sulfurtransferase